MSAMTRSTATSRRLQVGAREARLNAEEWPVGEETGLPLIQCPDCGLARVIERRSGNQATQNYLRVYFKCPRNGFPKLCGFYLFQRDYLEKLLELGFVRIFRAPAEEMQRGEAMAGLNDKAELEAKMEKLSWKFNLLMFSLAVVFGCVLMHFAMALK